MIVTVVATDGLSRALNATFNESLSIETPTILKWVKSSSNSGNILRNSSFLRISEKDQIRIININRLGEIVPNLFKIPEEEQKGNKYGIYLLTEQLKQNEVLENDIVKNSSIIVISDLFKLQANPKTLFSTLIDIKRKLDVNILLMAPNIHPFFYPILSYLGIDLFDNIMSEFLSNIGIGLSSSGEFTKKELNLSSEELLELNTKYSIKLVKEVRLKIINRSLRDLIKLSSNWNPIIRTLLRIIDFEEIDLIEKRTILARKVPLLCTDISDLNRVEVKRFSKRIVERFNTSDIDKVCLILPCSNKKPYSRSRTHQIILREIQKILGKKSRYISTLILTSPLGIVPRVLEEVYPAAHYDISVAGEWYEEEKIIISEITEKIINKYPLDTKFIVYLPAEEAEIIKNILPADRSEILPLEEPTTSKNSLEMLKNAIINITSEISEKTPLFKTVEMNKINNLVDYQFGKNFHQEFLTENYFLKEIRKQRYLFVNKQKYASIDSSTGLLQLELLAAEKMIKKEKNIVKFADLSFQGSSLYCAGISYADEDILPGDEIILVNKNDELLGVGRANLSGIDMVAYEKGLAVTIRKKVKKTNRGEVNE